jgi:hypothetical protein
MISGASVWLRPPQSVQTGCPVRLSEEIMSDEVIAIVITIAIIALLFVWVPLLNLICPPCGRFLEGLRLRKVAKEQTPMGIVRHKTS